MTSLQGTWSFREDDDVTTTEVVFFGRHDKARSDSMTSFTRHAVIS